MFNNCLDEIINIINSYLKKFMLFRVQFIPYIFLCIVDDQNHYSSKVLVMFYSDISNFMVLKWKKYCSHYFIFLKDDICVLFLIYVYCFWYDNFMMLNDEYWFHSWCITFVWCFLHLYSFISCYVYMFLLIKKLKLKFS